MPLHTYTYACGCHRYLQGKECLCYLNELLRINDPMSFEGPEANYLPFNTYNFYFSSRQSSRQSTPEPTSHRRSSTEASRPSDRERRRSNVTAGGRGHGAYGGWERDPWTSCWKHDRRYRVKYECPDHVARRARERWVQERRR